MAAREIPALELLLRERPAVAAGGGGPAQCTACLQDPAEGGAACPGCGLGLCRDCPQHKSAQCALLAAAPGPAPAALAAGLVSLLADSEAGRAVAGLRDHSEGQAAAPAWLATALPLLCTAGEAGPAELDRLQGVLDTNRFTQYHRWLEYIIQFLVVSYF